MRDPSRDEYKQEEGGRGRERVRERETEKETEKLAAWARRSEGCEIQ